MAAAAVVVVKLYLSLLLVHVDDNISLSFDKTELVGRGAVEGQSIVAAEKQNPLMIRSSFFPALLLLLLDAWMLFVGVFFSLCASFSLARESMRDAKGAAAKEITSVCACVNQWFSKRSFFFST